MAIRKSTQARQTPRRPAKRPKGRAVTQDLLDFLDIGKRIDPAELAKLPTDLVYNFDHYAHGSPRQD